MTAEPALVAKAQMLIRKPAAEVYAAFVEPETTTQFWFTKSSGRLAAGQTVQWDWEMYGASAQVTVKALEPNRRILIDWGEGNTVEWVFTPRGAQATLVQITNAGFAGDPASIAAQAVDAAEAFALVLAGLKAWLEHGLRLNLIADHHPDALVSR